MATVTIQEELKWQLRVNRAGAELASALLDPSNSIQALSTIILNSVLSGLLVFTAIELSGILDLGA